MGDVGWPSSVRGGGGKEERLGFGGCHVASFGAGGVEERRRGWGLSDVVWPSSVRGEGTDSGSGAGMTRGKVDKCEGKGTDCGSGGGGITRVREIGDGASPRFLAGPRNDTIVGMWLEWAGLGIQSLAGALEKATRGLGAVTIA